MKKLLIVTNVVTLVILYFSGCTTSRNSFILKDKRTLVSNYWDRPFTGLYSNMIKNVVSNYRTSTMYPYAASSDAAPADSRSVWFNLDIMKKFLWYVETESKKNGFTENEMKGLGIRMYYIRYPKNYNEYGEDLSGVNTAYRNLHSLLMVPTYTDANFLNRDFDPTKFDAPKKPTTYEKLLGTNQRLTVMPFYTNSQGNGFAMVQNHGDLIPPPALTGDGGAELLRY
jgi:hypothetical protein